MVGHLIYETVANAAVTQFQLVQLLVSPLSGFSGHA